jgi:hypothetical protein
MSPGNTYTIVGNATPDSDSGDGGPAISAGIADPLSLALDDQNNVIVADNGPNSSFHPRVGMVAEKTRTTLGQSVIKGDIYDVAGRESP